MIPMFPKPSQIKRKVEAVEVFRDGREVCTKTESGRKEYRRRIEAMRLRQNMACCLKGFIPQCPGYLHPRDATFEHEGGRGGGKQDDRIEIDGKWINGAAHCICNGLKGSRRINYNANFSMAGVL